MKERMRIGRRGFLGIACLIAVGSALAIYHRGETGSQPDSTNQILQEEAKEAIETPEKEERIEIILTGDVMLGRTVMTKSLDDEKDPTYPFKKVADTLNEADFVFVNLENPLVTNCSRIYSGFELCAFPEMVEGLVYAGVEIVTLANNHTRVYGQGGIDETVKVLNESGILATGLGELVTKEIKGVKFGFLGFDFASKFPIEKDFVLVEESRSQADVLIVGVHWGGEYHSEPTTFQKKWGKRLIESGADIVAGHGPHWVQEIEYVEGKPIFYSLGNFIFDQMWSEKTREGLVVRLIFEKEKLIEVEKLPIYISFWAQPEFIKDTRDKPL